jgi:predicted RNase H-like nuclease (RuvC/YqgF family)
MARKRLSDLLREEANKPEESETDIPTAADAGRRTNSRSVKQEGAAAPASASKTAAAKRSASTAQKAQAESEALKAVQERAQQQEAAFQQQIADLQAELDQQIALTRSLKADLEKIEPLKAELEQAKKVALQIAEENTRLNQALKAAQEQKVPAASQKVSATSQPATSQKVPTASSTGLATRESIQRQQARSLAHPIFPTDPLPGQISDQDLGWVD